MAKTLEQLTADTDTYYFSSLQTGIDNRCRDRMIARVLHYIKPGSSILELGFMDGQWTDHFLRMNCKVTAVEGSSRNVEYGRKKYAGNTAVSLIHDTFENYEPKEKFDWVHMGGVLKHLDDPMLLLKRSRGWLKPGGGLMATTPNPKSLHRRIGVAMGLLKNIDALSETDVAVGNLRHYDTAEFKALLEEGGYKVEEISTSILKPVSSDKMSDWPDNLIDALDKVVEEIPEFGWYIYAIGRP